MRIEIDPGKPWEEVTDEDIDEIVEEMLDLIEPFMVFEDDESESDLES